MTESDPHAPTTAAPEPGADAWRQPPAESPSFAAAGPEQKPEVLIGGAFAGGFLAAMILKRFGR